MPPSNVNLEPGYWDQIWQQEGRETWRRYPSCFGRICWAVGHMNEVLELGCGVGVLAQQLMSFGNVVTGLDISEAAIAQLPPDITGVVAVLPQIPLPDNSFDVVVATELLEHLDDDIACIKEIVRVLRPGGRAFLAVPDNCLGPDEEPEHVRKYSAESLLELLNPFGFVVMETFRDEFLLTEEDGTEHMVSLPTILAGLYI